MKNDLEQLKKLSELDKLEPTSPSVLQGASADQIVTAIVQVGEPNYVPPKVKVRAQISKTMFTAEFPAALLPTLEADPKVRSVALSRPQQLID